MSIRKWTKTSDSFQNSGCLNFCWLSDDHSQAINLEEFLILTQVCINRLKLMLKCHQILKDLLKMAVFSISTDSFVYDDYTAERFVKTNYNSVFKVI